MFSSFDRRFIVKTMNKSEQAVLVDALPDYIDHLRENKDSLIARIYGIFRVKMEEMAEVDLLLMGNLFEEVNHKESEFDLKGSMINREVFNFTMKDCLKDKNLLEISKNTKFLRFKRDDMHRICEQILSDINFMAKHRLMDYSLLLITEKNPNFKEKGSRKTTLITKTDKRQKEQESKEVIKEVDSDEEEDNQEKSVLFEKLDKTIGTNNTS